MNRALILIALLLPSLVTRAAPINFELGAGYVHTSRPPDGMWWQSPFPHTLNLNNWGALAGITGPIAPGYDWHVDLVYLGHVHTDALATPVDSNFDPSSETGCVGQCVAMTRYVGNGSLWGISATVEPYAVWQGLRWSVEAGPFVSFPTWREDVSNWKQTPDQPGVNFTVFNNATWALGAVAGVGVASGPLKLSLRYYWDKSGGDFPAAWTNTTTLMVIYRFR